MDFLEDHVFCYIIIFFMVPDYDIHVYIENCTLLIGCSYENNDDIADLVRRVDYLAEMFGSRSVMDNLVYFNFLLLIEK